MKAPLFVPLSLFSFASYSSNNSMPLFLETKSGDKVDEESLKGKVVALYFSSSWCEFPK
jgi:cytochrome oxidase Cu insertion factor (SCO1/SenC/PrrC family)